MAKEVVEFDRDQALYNALDEMFEMGSLESGPRQYSGRGATMALGRARPQSWGRETEKQKMPKQFLWAWGAHKPAEDSSMTPARAARLLRAWRNQMRTRVNGRPYFTVVRLLHMDGWREYRVTARCGEQGSLWVKGRETEKGTGHALR